MDLRSNPLAHRTVLPVPDFGGGFDAVREITARWLAGKFGEPPLASGQHRLNEVSLLTNQVAYNENGSERAIRLQLREDKPEATWRTTITAVTTVMSGLVEVSLEVFPNTEMPLKTGRPGLVRDLVHDLQVQDGPARLTLTAQDVMADGVEDLIDILCDPARQLPAIVIAQTPDPAPIWEERIRRSQPHCAGAASLFLLTDAQAVDAFRDAVGEHHRVGPGAVRTFLPEVDPAWQPDAARHRVLSLARLSDPQDRGWQNLYRSVQRLSAQAPLPEPLRGLSFPDPSGQRHREERQAALAAVRTSDELAMMRADINELKALLAQADEELKESARTAQLSARTVASLEAQLQEAVERADADTETALRALDDVERVRAEADELRRRLRRAQRYEDTVVVEQPPGVPASFQELLERCDAAFTGVLVTADPAKALALDEADRASMWAAKAWNALRVLHSYAQAAGDGFNGGFYQYCTSDRAGAVVWPRKQIAMAESQSTMNAWGDERIFPVPKDVDPSGLHQMQAHLKLESKGTTSPRIYFHDDTKGATERVIVGYIGPHLTNTKTN